MKSNFLDWSLLIVRLAFGFRILYGVIDNVIDWDRMIEFEHFLSANGFPFPLLAAVVSVYAQFLSSISWLAGYKIKISSGIMFLNFSVAIFGFHFASGDSYLGMAPAIHLAVISILLFTTGAGKLSLDDYLLRRSQSTSQRTRTT